MRTTYITLLTLIFIASYAFTEDGSANNNWYNNDNNLSHAVSPVLIYDVHGLYKLPVRQGTLLNAKKISDINSGYPVNWIQQYVSTEIKVAGNNKVKRASGKNNLLTPEQIRLIKTAGLGIDIEVDVTYKYNNDATEIPETSSIHFSSTVIPEIEAAFAGGYSKLRKYLDLTAVKNIIDNSNGDIHRTVVRFTVNEEGKITNAHMTRSSEIPEIDQMLLNAINKMPAWIPAKNSEGKNVKQDFEFTIENGGC